MDHHGYIKNRNIGFNIRQIQDIIDYSDLANIDGVILFLDLKKTFDTVEHNLMIKVLQLFGFGHSFIRWIKTFYSNITSCIYNNGWRSQTIHPSRGLKQGCSLSALIYILVAEILATKLRENHNFKGIKITGPDQNDICFKLTQLADDTTIFAQDKNDAIHALRIVDEFSLYSGLQLNKQKTECLWIGRLKTSTDSIEEVKYSREVKALGIIFSTEENLNAFRNWEKPFEACRNIIESWSKRHLTFYGKVTVIKTLLLSKFVYLFQTLNVSKKIIDDINKLFFDFLWSGKQEKIKRKTLIAPYQDGGLNMIDVDTFVKSVKLKWIRSLLNKEDANWKQIPKLLLNQYGENLLVFYMNVTSTKYLPKPPIKLTSFYENILSTWLTLNANNNKPPNTFVEIRQQLIWGNKNITLKGKCVLFKTWINSNLFFINDIINQRTGEIDEALILTKLKNKTNWISQINIIKSAIPKDWKHVLKTNQSKQTKVKTKLEVKIRNRNIFSLQNRDFYKLIIDSIYVKPYMHKKWEQYLNQTINWAEFYLSMKNNCIDNRIKQFKFKLIHNILAYKENLYRWKISQNSLCNICNVQEDLEHFFLRCAAVVPVWNVLIEVFSQCGIRNNIATMKNIIIGYKSTQEGYNDINLVLNLIGFCIYKCYYMSDKRESDIDILRIFKYEFNVMYAHRKSKKQLTNFLKKFEHILFRNI